MEEELQKLTVVRLKEKLTEKGLDTKGVKAVLVKRLLEALQNEAEKTGETSKDATESESPVLGGDISQLDGDDDTNGKETRVSEVTDGESGITTQDGPGVLSDDQAAIERTNDAPHGEAVKRDASFLAEEGDSKRQRLGSENDDMESQETRDQSETGDKAYLSLIGDESSGNEADGIADEPALTDQQESSLLGEDSVEASNPDDDPVDAGKDRSENRKVQNAPESDNDIGLLQKASQGPPVAPEAVRVEGAQASEKTEEAAQDQDLKEESSGTTGESEFTKDKSDNDLTKDPIGVDDSCVPTEGKSAKSRNSSSGEDLERKKSEWIRQQETNITLDEYTSDLNCLIDRESMSVTPFTESHFALLSAGVKCSHGFTRGKIRFDVKVLELLEADVEGKKHQLRTGFCRRLQQQSVRLGDDKHSWALCCCSGKKATEGNFESFVDLPDLKVGDVFSSLLDLDQNPAKLRFAHNGNDLGVAFELPGVETEEVIVSTTTATATTSDEEKSSKTPPTTDGTEVEKRGGEIAAHNEEQSAEEPGAEEKPLAFYPAVLTKNVKVEVDLGQLEERLSIDGDETDYVFPKNVEESARVKDDIAPYTKRECELIMMIGLPSSGKSTWVKQQVVKHPEKHYNVLGAANILNRLTTGDGSSEVTQEGSDELVKKAANCLAKLIDRAAKQRRNVILDETNVNGSVQANKWRLFDGYKRRAVVVVVDADTLAERHAKRLAGEVLFSSKTVTEMKACFEIPSGSHFRGCVTFAELPRDEAERVVDKYNDEAAKELGIEPRRKRRHLSHSDFNRSGNGSRNFHRGPPGSFSRSSYGDFRPRGGSARGNFYSGPSWGPMRGGGPNTGPGSRWGRGGGMPPQHFHPSQSTRGSHLSGGGGGGGRPGAGGSYSRNGSEGGGGTGLGGRLAGGDYRSQRPDWKSSTYQSNSRDRDSDDRSGRDSRKYSGRDYRGDSRDSRDSGRDGGWSRGGDRREPHTRFSQSSPGRWDPSPVSTTTGSSSRFSSQVSPQRSNPSYDSAQKPWTQHQPPQQPQHRPVSHGGSSGLSSWSTSQSQPAYAPSPQAQPAQQQQQWHQWQQWYSDPRQRTPAQNPEPWKGQHPNQWVTAPGPRAGVPDTSQKPYQLPQHQTTQQQQQQQWNYWQQWQQRPSAGSHQAAAGPAVASQYDNAQQYQQQIAQWKQQCARYYEQNQQQPHQSQHK